MTPVLLTILVGKSFDMDTLLSLSFDNLSSRDAVKIGKGIRQVEGVLAQICLSGDKHSRPDTTPPATEWQLEKVAADPAFREFFRLQEGFQYNGMPRDYIRPHMDW